MRVPFIDLKIQYGRMRNQVRRALNRVADSQKFILGENVLALEQKVAKANGARHGIGVASGSDALYLSLLALGIGAGDEVITAPFTFFATAGAISRTGAKPVFADIDAATFNLDPKKFEEKINSKTKAVLPVHLFGLACQMQEILGIAKKHSLFVVEDAAQSLGAQTHGKAAGAFGDAGCFSFYPTKNLGGAGDGGMVITSSDKLADKIRVLRDHGSREKYYHEWIGINSRLDELQAAVLLEKFGYLNHWNRLRQKHAADYDRGLKGLPIELPFVPEGSKHIYHLYSILTKKRDALAAFLAKKGIGSGIYYPLPLHLQPCYKNLGYKDGDFPVAERVCREILSLPMYPELKASQKKEVLSAVRGFFGGKT